MSPTVIGLFAGLLVGLGIAIDGFSGFLLLLVFGAIGFAVGKVLEGDVDVAGMVDRASNATRGRGSR